MIIEFGGSMEQFWDGVAELLKRGITFNADAYNCTITLTGGY